MKKVAIAMTIILLMGMLSGCGKKEVKIPKLEDPKSSDKVTYEIVKKDISNEEVKWGAISPLVTYITVPKTGVIAEMVANPGERVKKGDVILRYDVKETKEELEAAKKERDSLKQSSNNQIMIANYQLEQKKLAIADLKKEQKMEASENVKASSKEEEQQDASADENGQEGQDAPVAYAKEIALLNVQIKGIENDIAYQKENYTSQNQIYQEQIDGLQKEINESEIKAPANGYVMAYISGESQGGSDGKTPLETGKEVEKNAILAWFANEDIPVVETEAEEYSDKVEKESDYPEDTVRKFFAGDKEYDLTLYQYDAEQQEIITKGKVNKQIQYAFTEPVDMEIGLTGMVTFSSKKRESVLAVLVNAVEEDDEGRRFVYIEKNGKEKKTFIETGSSTQEYYEVTKGLKEGDVVAYTEYYTDLYNTQGDKITKKQMTIKKGEVDNSYDQNLFNNVAPLYINMVNMNLEGEQSVISKQCFSQNDPVKKGDIVAYTDYKTPNSELEQMKASIKEQKDSITEAEKQYQDTLDDIDAQIDNAQTENEKKSLEYDKKIALINKNQIVYDANMQLKDLNEQNTKLLAAKAGTPIYSTISGYIVSNIVNENMAAEPGEPIVKVASRENCYAKLDDQGAYLQLGRRLTLVDEDGKEYKATVICSQACLGNDISASGIYGQYGAMIRFDDKDIPSNVQFVREKYDAPGVKNVLVLPGAEYDVKVQSYMSEDQYFQTEEYYVTVVKKDGSREKRRVQVSPYANKTEGRWVISGVEEGDTLEYYEYSDNMQ